MNLLTIMNKLCSKQTSEHTVKNTGQKQVKSRCLTKVMKF